MPCAGGFTGIGLLSTYISIIKRSSLGARLPSQSLKSCSLNSNNRAMPDSLPAKATVTGVPLPKLLNGPHRRPMQPRPQPPPSAQQSPTAPLPAGFHPDVENVVNGYFESLFAGQLSSEELVRALKNLKLSANIHERQIHDCLVRNLFEEFKFFPNYPEKELETVAVFVGQIVAADILHPTSQSTALSFILEAMKKPTSSRLFQFAQIALVHFYRRIPEWAQFMESLTRSPNYEHLPELVRAHLANAHRDDAVAASQHMDSLKAALAAGPVREPPEKLREKIHFAVNNLTEENLPMKAEDVRAMLTPEYFPWFVEYFMSERIILENNLHTPYHELIVAIGAPGLVDLFMSTSLAKARVLLLSFESLPAERRDSIQLRSILKNLAQWIGLLFFSRNRPILRSDLCLRTLLTAQVSNDYYTFVLPFTCKLLEKTTLSTVLLPTNPWISSLLRLLVEIYVFVDLKLNSKFEIELLFKGLGVDMKTIQPSHTLRRQQQPRYRTVNSANPQQANAAINQLAIAEIGPAQVERICAIASKTVAALIQKDAAALGHLPEALAHQSAVSVATALFEATSKDAIRSVLYATFRKYLSASGPVEDARLAEMVEGSFPSVLAATHDMIVQNLSSLAIDTRSSSGAVTPPGLPPNPHVQSAYTELVEAVQKATIAPAVDQAALSKQVAAQCAAVLQDIERLVGGDGQTGEKTSSDDAEIKACMKKIVNLASTSEPGSRDEVCLAISQKLVQFLFKASAPLLIDVSIVLLAKIFEYSARVSKEVTNWILVSGDERKFNVPAMVGLVSAGLVYVLDFDLQLARQIEANSPRCAVGFGVSFIRRCVMSGIAAPYDLVYSLEALGRVLKRAASSVAQLPAREQTLPQDAKDIMALMEEISKKVAAASDPAANPQNDPVKFKEIVSFWFSDWFRLCQYPSDASKQSASFMSQLSQKEAFFKRPEKAAHFFKICGEVAIELFLHQKHAPALLNLRGVECFVKLAVGLATWPAKPGTLIGDSELLRIGLGEFVSVLLTAVDQQPVLLKALGKLLMMCTAEVTSKLKRPASKPYQLAIASLLDVLNPVDFPAGLAAWVETVSSGHFLSTWLFEYPEEPVLNRTLLQAVDFLSQPAIVDSPGRSPALALAYQAILRLFVGVAHDRPDVLLGMSGELLSRLDPHYIQLRNLFLATIPMSVSLPDPFAPDFVLSAPPTGTTVGGLKLNVKADDRTEAAVLKSIAGMAMDTNSLTASFFFAFSQQLAAQVTTKPEVSVDRLAEGLLRTMSTLMADTQSGPDQVYSLLFHLTDNLRYPSPETHFFILLFVSMFKQAQSVNQDVSVREIITRCLLERLIVHKPHPWGLIVAFLEIIKRGDFWSCPFTAKTPEIKRMFESVAKTCGSAKVSSV